jgi:hypothetical protein
MTPALMTTTEYTRGLAAGIDLAARLAAQIKQRWGAACPSEEEIRALRPPNVPADRLQAAIDEIRREVGTPELDDAGVRLRIKRLIAKLDE